MAKLEQVLKSEVVRLAKKQIKMVCVPLAREVRELKRRLSELTKIVAPLDRLRAELEAKRKAEGARLEAPPEQVETSRLSPSLIQKLRKRLGINQAQLARLLGVSGSAVLFWERGRSRPRGRNKAAIIALRGLGRREVKRMLAEKAKAEPAPRKVAKSRPGRKRSAQRKKAQRGK